MATIDTTRLTKHLDSLAAIYALLRTHLGDGSGAASASAGAASILTDILDTEDNTVVADLRAAGYLMSEKLKYKSSLTSAGNTVGSLVRGYFDALRTHLGNNLDTALATLQVRVHPDLQALYYDCYQAYLARAVVFPSVVTLGSVACAAGETTFTAGSDIPVTEGPGQLEVVVTSAAIGAEDWVLTLTCQTLAGLVVEKIVTVPGLSKQNNTINVGSASDIYVDVTAVTATGGTNGDAVSIRTKLLRSPALIVTAP